MFELAQFLQRYPTDDEIYANTSIGGVQRREAMELSLPLGSTTLFSNQVSNGPFNFDMGIIGSLERAYARVERDNFLVWSGYVSCRASLTAYATAKLSLGVGARSGTIAAMRIQPLPYPFSVKMSVFGFQASIGLRMGIDIPWSTNMDSGLYMDYSVSRTLTVSLDSNDGIGASVSPLTVKKTPMNYILEYEAAGSVRLAVEPYMNFGLVVDLDVVRRDLPPKHVRS